MSANSAAGLTDEIVVELTRPETEDDDSTGETDPPDGADEER